MGGSRRVPLPTAATTPPSARKPTARSSSRGPRRTAITALANGAARAATATYVYGVVRSATAPSIPRGVSRLPGGGPPRALPVTRGRWLVVADVPRGDFGQRALEARFKDLEWVSRCGVAHSAVVDHYLHTATATVVPMTLFTIFDDDARALEQVRRDWARLDASLDQVAGRTEWVVRVLRAGPTPGATARLAADGRRAAAEGAEALATVPASAAGAASVSTATRRATSGRAFLQAKADQRLAAARAAREAEAAVRALAQGLTEVADAVSTRTDVSGLGSTALLDAVFLVARSSEARFKREARRLGRPLTERGYRVSVTGPWVCYYFTAGRPSS